MGLFSKNKDDFAQTQEIKSAASVQQPPSFNQNTYQNSQTMPQNTIQPQQNSQQTFVNPFQENNSQNRMQTQLNNQSTMNSTLNNNLNLNNNPQSNFFESSNNIQQENNSNNSLDEDQIRELIVENVEKIIDEKWEKVTSNVESVLNWKEKVENEIDLLKHDIATIKEGFEQFEKRLMNKVSTYDRNILDVNSEIKALEKVFNKITPTLVNNVNELSKIAQDLRGIKGENKPQN